MSKTRHKEDGNAELAWYRKAIEASGDVVYDWDLATDRMRWSGVAEKLFGAGPDGVPGSGDTFQRQINPEDLPQRTKTLADHFAGIIRYDCEYRVRGENGEFQWVHDRGMVDLSASGTPSSMVGVLRFITPRKQREAQLEYLANYDDLTGHYNKLRIREALDHALANAIRFEQEGAYLVVGVDQLSRINTAYGFEAGDAALVEVAHRMDRVMRASDVIGRPGGDRFGVILSCCSQEEAKAAAERILETVRQSQIDVGGKLITVTASVGIVTFPGQSQTSFDVMAKADGALLKAKASGRDCGYFYEMTEAQRRDYRVAMDIGEEVQQALKQNRLLLAYQPVVNAQTHEPNYYECLVRLRREDGKLIAAGEFIPVVEQLGYMRHIDRYVLYLSLDVLELHPGVTLAINISSLTASERSWLRILVSRLKNKPEVARRLMIEITETAALQDIEESARFVSSIRELGCMVALDDFGAGYTTFRHLKALTVDVLKIDGSFIDGITTSPENQMFIRNLLALSRALDLKTVAERVETIEEAKFLSNLGIDNLQGYYFGAPDLEPAWLNLAALSERRLSFQEQEAEEAQALAG